MVSENHEHTKRVSPTRTNYEDLTVTNTENLKVATK